METSKTIRFFFKSIAFCFWLLYNVVKEDNLNNGENMETRKVIFRCSVRGDVVSKWEIELKDIDETFTKIFDEEFDWKYTNSGNFMITTLVEGIKVFSNSHSTHKKCYVQVDFSIEVVDNGKTIIEETEFDNLLILNQSENIEDEINFFSKGRNTVMVKTTDGTVYLFVK